ncbi:unnamed protein product, partial [Linum tenue]
MESNARIFRDAKSTSFSTTAVLQNICSRNFANSIPATYGKAFPLCYMNRSFPPSMKLPAASVVMP